MEFKWAHWAPLIGIVFVMFLLFTSNRGLLEGMTNQSTQDTMVDGYADMTKKIKGLYQGAAESVDKYRPQFEDIMISTASMAEYGMANCVLQAGTAAGDINKPTQTPEFDKAMALLEKYKSLRQAAEDVLGFMDKSN
jgi:hypothetical protein